MDCSLLFVCMCDCVPENKVQRSVCDYLPTILHISALHFGLSTFVVGSRQWNTTFHHFTCMNKGLGWFLSYSSNFIFPIEFAQSPWNTAIQKKSWMFLFFSFSSVFVTWFLTEFWQQCLPSLWLRHSVPLVESIEKCEGWQLIVWLSWLSDKAQARSFTFLYFHFITSQ